MSEGEEENPQSEQKMRKALMEQLKRQQAEQQRKEILRTLVEPPAFERIMNIRLSNPDLYGQLVNLIISLAQQNRLQGKLTEQQLLQILEKVTSRPDTKIEYKRK